MKSERIQKAQSISKKIISEYIVTELQELSIEHGIITVTHTKISQDLWYIDTYVSCLNNPEKLCKSLAEHAHNIQRVLAKKIDFLKVPRLRFRYDESGESSSEIYKTIKDLDIQP